MDGNFNVDSVTHSNFLHVKHSRLANYGSKMIRVSGPTLWNRIPQAIRDCKSFYLFKLNVKRFFLDQYRTPNIPVDGHYYVKNLSM